MLYNKPFVSIVIPCFNEEKYIGQCIDSIRNQHYDSGFEVIAVDNSSTDDTVRIIIDKGAILENAKKRGPAAAKNKGIEKAKGDIIVFIDADCVAHPDWLKRIVEPFQNLTTGCVAGEIIPNDPKTMIEKFLCSKKHLFQSVNISHPFLPFAATANAAYKREIFEKNGFFDENLFIGEDADMSWRMQLFTNYKLTYIPDATVFHPHESRPKELFRQKRRHAYGSVMLYKKYKRYRKGELKSLKQTYWEYRSLIHRGLKLFFYKFRKNLGLKDIGFAPVNEYQLILEIAWKVGLIQGSLRHRVWYV